jgi:sorting nexin-13
VVFSAARQHSFLRGWLVGAHTQDILFNRAPPALVRIVGRSRYTGAVKDIYHILQSPTFMAQLGHGMVEILVMHLMPELKPLLEDIRSSQLA